MKISPAESALTRNDITVAELPMAIWPGRVYPLEPVYGWMQRAAAANHAYSTESFLSSLGLNGLDWDFDEQLEIAEKLPLIGLSALRRNTPKRRGNAYEICGKQLPTRFFRKDAQRLCPVCLDAARYVRVWFDLASVVACPFHDVELISGLPGDPIDWRNPEFGITRSGLKLSTKHARPMPASALDHYLVHSLCGSMYEAPPHLADEAITDVILASLCIGKLYRADEKFRPSHSDRRELAQAGFSALVRGVASVTNYLSSAPWLKENFDQARYQATNNNTSYIIRTIPSQRLRDMVKKAFGSARVESGATAPFGKMAQFDGKAGACTLKSAAKSLGVRPEYLKGILKAQSLATPQCSVTGTHRISDEDMDTARHYMATCLDVSKASEALGCSGSDIEELVRRKLLKVEFPRRGRRYFHKDAIQALVDQALSPRTFHSSQPISLKQYAQDSNRSLAEAYSLLVARQTLKLVEHDASVPFFEGAKVARILPTKSRPNAQCKDPMSFARVASRLGTDRSGLRILIDLAYLKTVSASRRRLRICELSLKVFEEAYAKASDYAALLNCHPTVALKKLRKAGVQPINECSGHKARFVCRAEVERQTGLILATDDRTAQLQSLADDIGNALDMESIAATVRRLSDPALVVRGSNGRWSFRIETSPQESGLYTLICNFRASHEHARLKRANAVFERPDDIWPGANVEDDSRGGFVIIDQSHVEPNQQNSLVCLVARCVMRARELHRLL